MSPCVFITLCIAFTSRFKNMLLQKFTLKIFLPLPPYQVKDSGYNNRLSGIHYVRRLTALSHSSLVGLIGWGWWRVCVRVHCTIACLGLVHWSGSLDSRSSSWESMSCGSNYKVTLTCELCPQRWTAYVCVTAYWYSIASQEVSLCIVNLTFGHVVSKMKNIAISEPC